CSFANVQFALVSLMLSPLLFVYLTAPLRQVANFRCSNGANTLSARKHWDSRFEIVSKFWCLKRGETVQVAEMIAFFTKCRTCCVKKFCMAWKQGKAFNKGGMA